MKKLDELLKRTGISIVKDEYTKYGIFTIAVLADSKGHEAVGVSRKSEHDRYSDAVGLSIAKGRAERALYNKLNNKPIRHSYMG